MSNQEGSKLQQQSWTDRADRTDFGPLRDETRALKQGRLRELLTGRVRLR